MLPRLRAHKCPWDLVFSNHSHSLACSQCSSVKGSAVLWFVVWCSAVQWNVACTVQYSGMLCCAVQYNAVKYSAVQCNKMQCCTVQCSAVQGNAVLYSAVQWNAVLCSTKKYSIVQCSAVQCSVWLGSSLRLTASNLFYAWPSSAHSAHSTLSHPIAALARLAFLPLFCVLTTPSFLLYSSDPPPCCTLHLSFLLTLPVFAEYCFFWCCPPPHKHPPPPTTLPFSVSLTNTHTPHPPPLPLLKSVWSPLIPSVPGVVVLGWMSAPRIRVLKRAEQQPKPWNPLNLSFSLARFNWHC